MDFNARQEARELRNYARDERHSGTIHFVCQTMQQDGVKAGVAEEDFEDTLGRRIFAKNSVDLLAHGPKHGDFSFLDDRLRQKMQ